jgi:hypothetical protein
MAFRNPSNQLIQIDTGSTRTYLYNKALSPIQVYADIGEVQVLGQRYFGVANTSVSNPYGAPAIFQLVKYLSTSAVTTANLTTAGAPAPVYWTDNTFTTVTGILSEALNGSAQYAAGYLMLNIVSLPTLTAAQLLGAQVFVQVAGYLKGAYAPITGVSINNWISGAAGAFQSSAAATAPTVRTLGVQMTAVASGLADVLVGCDII